MNAGRISAFRARSFLTERKRKAQEKRLAKRLDEEQRHSSGGDAHQNKQAVTDGSRFAPAETVRFGERAERPPEFTAVPKIKVRSVFQIYAAHTRARLV